MRCALKIRILLLVVIHIGFDVRVTKANPGHKLFSKPIFNRSEYPIGCPAPKNLPPQNRLPKRSHGLLVSSLLEQKKVDPTLETVNSPADNFQSEKERLPLVKVAHANVMDLLQLYFVPQPMHLPSYTPFVEQVGIRLNWLSLLRNFWSNAQKRYGGGIDLQLRGSIQLSFDIGYLFDQPTDRVYGNRLSYRSKGSYGLGALLYVIHPNHLSNAYWGIAYGQSRFDLRNFHSATPTSQPCVAFWLKCIGGSERRLVAQLYGGMQLGIAHLLYCTKNDDGGVSNYSIPGYGKIVNKSMPDITLYLKWSISFLEKKIVI